MTVVWHLLVCNAVRIQVSHQGTCTAGRIICVIVWFHYFQYEMHQLFVACAVSMVTDLNYLALQNAEMIYSADLRSNYLEVS
jgi:hypothetical protein